MNKEEIKKRYNKLIANIEHVRIYDGRGTYDFYQCERCGKPIVTLYVNKGVTPFVMQCPGCGGNTVHKYSFKTLPYSITGVLVRRWVRPTFEQLLKLNPATIEYVLNGGLVFEEELK